MPSRNTRYWRSFLLDLLSSNDALYDGVCVFTHTGHIEYRDGCFKPSSSSLDVDLLQLLAIFDQLTRQAILQRSDSGSQSVDVTPALRLGDSTLHVISATFTSVCAVSAGKSSGLVAQRLPFGVLVVAFSAPATLESVFAHVDSRCAELRRF